MVWFHNETSSALKRGNKCDSNNYRAIAISIVIGINYLTQFY